MAQIQPVLPHIALTMDVDEAELVWLGLDTLRLWAQEDVPEIILAFTKDLGAQVERLRHALEPDAEVEATMDDGLAAA